jgi:hypothetical protein
MPLQIEPVRLSERDRKRVASILDPWIEEAIEARLQKEHDWKDALRAYEGKPKTENKSWPWPDCSNQYIPLEAIVTDTIAPRMHRAIYSQDRIYKMETQDDRPEMADAARDLDSFANFEMRNRIRLSQKTQPAEWDSIQLGTGVLKGAYEDLRRVQLIPQQDGKPLATEVFDAYGPCIDHVPLEDVLFPADATQVNGPNRCLFVDHVIPMRWDQLVARKAYGYEGVDEIRGQLYTDWSLDIKEERDRLAGIQRIRRDHVGDIHEVWCNFPVYELEDFPNRRIEVANGKAIEREFVELCITYYMRQQRVLRVLENWYECGVRPFWAIPYIRRSSSIYGMGVWDISHRMVEGVSTIVNQRIDNSTVANTRIWKARKLSVPRGLQIFPSKVIQMDDPNDLEPVAMGDVAPSTFANEQSLVGYIERRTGVSDAQQGRLGGGNEYATASGTMSILEEGNIRFDFTLDEWREHWASIGMWALSCFRQFGYHYTDALVREFGPDKAQRIQAALELFEGQPTYALFSMDLVVTKASDTEQAQVQRNQVLFDISERVYMRLLEIVGMVTRGMDATGAPITESQKVIVYEAIQAILGLYKRILHSFQISDTETYLPNMQALEQAATLDQQVLAMNQMQAMQGGAQGAGPGGPGGQGAEGAGGGVSDRGRPPSPTSARQQPGGGAQQAAAGGA